MHILKQSMPLTDSAYLNICMQKECEFVDYFICLASAIAGYLFSLLNALEGNIIWALRKHYCDFFSFFCSVLGKQAFNVFCLRSSTPRNQCLSKQIATQWWRGSQD